MTAMISEGIASSVGSGADLATTGGGGDAIAAGTGAATGETMSDLTPLKTAWIIAAIPMSRSISSKPEVSAIPRREKSDGGFMIDSKRNVTVFLRWP